MNVIKISDSYVEIDVREELDDFNWVRARWTDEKLIACSPFREDNTPSFFVNLKGDLAGLWGDSGGHDEEWSKGGFLKLLSYLREETYSETLEYLKLKYGYSEPGADNYKIHEITIPKKEDIKYLDETLLHGYQECSSYLAERGITYKVQKFMGVREEDQNKFIVIPWRHVSGRLANIKHRSINSKNFWYRKGAEPIRNLVYGIDKVYRHNFEDVYVCEAEIDALSVYSTGKPAVAIGGASVNRTQLNAIRKSPAKRVVIAVDNDKAGAKVKRQLIEGLRGYVDLRELRLPDGVKDVNEALVAGRLDVEDTQEIDVLRFTIS